MKPCWLAQLKAITAAPFAGARARFKKTPRVNPHHHSEVVAWKKAYGGWSEPGNITARREPGRVAAADPAESTHYEPATMVSAAVLFAQSRADIDWGIVLQYARIVIPVAAILFLIYRALTFRPFESKLGKEGDKSLDRMIRKGKWEPLEAQIQLAKFDFEDTTRFPRIQDRIAKTAEKHRIPTDVVASAFLPLNTLRPSVAIYEVLLERRDFDRAYNFLHIAQLACPDPDIVQELRDRYDNSEKALQEAEQLDPYEVLGVAHDASWKTVREAYASHQAEIAANFTFLSQQGPPAENALQSLAEHSQRVERAFELLKEEYGK